MKQRLYSRQARAEELRECGVHMWCAWPLEEEVARQASKLTAVADNFQHQRAIFDRFQKPHGSYRAKMVTGVRNYGRSLWGGGVIVLLNHRGVDEAQNVVYVC